MGGFGALRLGFTHPDVFGVVYAISACCIDDMLVSSTKPQNIVNASTAKTAEELAQRNFMQRAVVAAGAAFTPDLGAAPLLVDLPFVAGPDGPQPAEAVQRVWASMLATSSIASQKDSITRLRGIGLEVGDHDEVAPITSTSHAMDRALTAAGIPHDFHEFDGGHADRVGEQLQKAALPFASRHLTFAAGPSR